MLALEGIFAVGQGEKKNSLLCVMLLPSYNTSSFLPVIWRKGDFSVKTIK